MAKGDIFWKGLDEYKAMLLKEAKQLPKLVERETKDLAIKAGDKMEVIIGRVTGEGSINATSTSITHEVLLRSTENFTISVGPNTKYAGWLDDGTRGRLSGLPDRGMIPIRDKAGNPTAFLLWVRRISGLPLKPDGPKKRKVRDDSPKPPNKNKGKRKKNVSKIKYADDLAFVMSRSITNKGTKAKNFIKFTKKSILGEQRRSGQRIIHKVKDGLKTRRT